MSEKAIQTKEEAIAELRGKIEAFEKNYGSLDISAPKAEISHVNGTPLEEPTTKNVEGPATKSEIEVVETKIKEPAPKTEAVKAEVKEPALKSAKTTDLLKEVGMRTYEYLFKKE